MEYVTDALLDHLSEEIVTQAMDHLHRYAVEQAQAKDYVRETQVRLLVRPLLERLRAELGSDAQVEEQCLCAAHALAHGRWQQPGLWSGQRDQLCSKRCAATCAAWTSHGSPFVGRTCKGSRCKTRILSGAVMRECVFTEAFDAITAVAISRSGQYWAALSRRGEVRVWREEGKLLHLAWQAHTDTTFALALSPDEHTLASGSDGWQRQAVGRREWCLALVGLAHAGHHVPGLFPRWKPARQWGT